MKIEGKEYRTIWYEGNIVKIIDQTKLPHQFIIKELKTVNDAINAIVAVFAASMIELRPAKNNNITAIDSLGPIYWRAAHLDPVALHYLRNTSS